MRRIPHSVRPIAALALAAVAVIVAGAGSSPRQADAQAPAVTLPSLGPVPISAMLPPRISGRAAVVLDGDTGAVLMGKNAQQPLAVASLTKILTALVALQTVDMRQRVIARFSPDELDPDSTIMGLKPGDEVTIEDLLYGLMLPSGNDAALVLARAVAGSDTEFVAMMNRAAAANGLQTTLFVNAHGLDQPGHHSSAHDIAQIARLAMRDPRFQQIVRTPSWTIRGDRTYTVANRNPFLTAYPGADGVKIGWTDDAGQTIVASATRDGHRVIVAVMDTLNRVADSAALMDWAFANFRWPAAPAVTLGAGR